MSQSRPESERKLLPDRTWHADTCNLEAENALMQHGQHRYVLLRFAAERKGHAQTAFPLLIVQNIGKLKIHIQDQWESGFDPADREYLSGLLDDWTDASAKDIPAILDQLSELSIGPLRAVESGFADPERLQVLLQQIPSKSR